jgi:hypothetical protein
MRSGSVLGRTAGGISEIGQAIRRELNSGAPEAFPSERKEIMTRTPFRSDNIAIIIRLHRIRLIVITRTAGHEEHASSDQTHAKPSESLLETSAAVPLGDAWVDAGFLAYPPRGYRPCMPTLPILPPPSLLATTPRFTETLSDGLTFSPAPSCQRERRKLARR